MRNEYSLHNQTVSDEGDIWVRIVVNSYSNNLRWRRFVLVMLVTVLVSSCVHFSLSQFYLLFIIYSYDAQIFLNTMMNLL